MTQYHIGKWNEILQTNQAELIWAELHRIVSKNRLSRNHVKFDGLVDEGKYNYFVDLTQELFVLLLEKNRFQHYINNEMSDVEIEVEISQIEVSNMMAAKLRKRFPERFRMSRRISNILKTSELFFEFSQIRKTRLSDKLFALNNAVVSTTIPTDNEISILVASIPHVTRDTRYVGATGDTQIIISNKDLETLIYNIMWTVGMPMTVAQIRNSVMSKLNLMDINITHVEEIKYEDDKVFDIGDTRLNPEQIYIGQDFESKISGIVDEFMWKLSVLVKHKQKQYRLVCNIVYSMYLTDPFASQLEISKKLGVSDALVSGYRKNIEPLLKELGINTISEAKLFEQALRKRIKQELEK